MQENYVPAVPLFINTFYPPNQPSVRRCFSLGNALVDAIESWDEDLRVAVIGSGGMSHFVVDEELDRGFLDAMKRKDEDALMAIPPYNFRSGSSELKNWIPVAGAMNEVGLEDDVRRLPAALSLGGRHRQRHGVRLSGGDGHGCPYGLNLACPDFPAAVFNVTVIAAPPAAFFASPFSAF